MSDFRQLQREFAQYLRDPEKNAAPADIEERRLNVYRELFFNNIRSLLAGTFPVLHRILGDDRWAQLMRAFYSQHVSHTPLFMEVPQEFLAWLNEEFHNDGSWPDFMPELAHYEWVELDVSIDPCEIDQQEFDPHGNMLEGVPVLSPVARVLAYQYPVHRIGPDFRPDRPGEQPVFLVVYRKRNDEVGFTEINAVTARLLELISENTERSGRELLTRIADETGQPEPRVLIEAGLEILEKLKQQEIVLGTRR